MTYPTWRNLAPTITLKAEDLEMIHFIIGSELTRIRRDTPDAFDYPDSYASRVSRLCDFITSHRNHNLTPQPFKNPQEAHPPQASLSPDTALHDAVAEYWFFKP